MEHDPKTGRFLPGNKAAVGNRGNRNPKWGNKNAVKHGFFTEVFFPHLDHEGEHLLLTSQRRRFRLKPGYFKIEDSRIWIHAAAVPLLEKVGVKLDEEAATK